MDIRELDQPLNIDERYLYGINVRLGILIEMFSSFLEAYANDKGYGITNAITETGVEIPEKEIIEEFIEIDLEEVDYNSFTKAELQEILTHKKIDFNTRMTKVELIELLK